MLGYGQKGEATDGPFTVEGQSPQTHIDRRGDGGDKDTCPCYCSHQLLKLLIN